jgi:glycosyltransferase involved in cell wall biosynthesis
MHILIITCGYYPAPGGAANYSHILAHLLTDYSVAQTVEVFTERYPSTNADKLNDSPRITVRRAMPWRATREKKGHWSRFLYIVQLLQISALLLKESRRFDAILFHGSLIYRTSFLARIVGLAKLLSKSNRTRYFLDIRDPLMPSWAAQHASRFDDVIACSKNVFLDLTSKGVPENKIREIPIPLTSASYLHDQNNPLCTSFGLKKEGYVFVAHGFMPGKRTEDVVEAVGCLRKQGWNLSLAVAGRARFWPEDATRAQEEGWLHFLGPLPNNDVRALMAECLIHVNVCTDEGLPRGSLEAIDAGALTVLPPNVPEFETCCTEWIGTAGEPQRLAEEIKAIIRKGRVAPYPVEKHYPQTLAKEYKKLFQGY